MEKTNSVVQQLLPIPIGWRDWIADNVADESLRDLIRDLLDGAIRICNTHNHEDLIFTIHGWKATIEELSRPPKEIEAILRSRDEIKRLVTYT